MAGKGWEMTNQQLSERVMRVLIPQTCPSRETDHGNLGRWKDFHTPRSRMRMAVKYEPWRDCGDGEEGWLGIQSPAANPVQIVMVVPAASWPAADNEPRSNMATCDTSIPELRIVPEKPGMELPC